MRKELNHISIPKLEEYVNVYFAEIAASKIELGNAPSGYLPWVI
jgi:hypothetical protein